MTSLAPPICVGCVHRISERGWSCTAYPNGIPDEIIRSKVDHRQPHIGDHGIRFEPVDDEAAEFASLLFGQSKRMKSMSRRTDPLPPRR
jgi:hypothetical protein